MSENTFGHLIYFYTFALYFLRLHIKEGEMFLYAIKERYKDGAKL